MHKLISIVLLLSSFNSALAKNNKNSLPFLKQALGTNKVNLSLNYRCKNGVPYVEADLRVGSDGRGRVMHKSYSATLRPSDSDAQEFLYDSKSYSYNVYDNKLYIGSGVDKINIGALDQEVSEDMLDADQLQKCKNTLGSWAPIGLVNHSATLNDGLFVVTNPSATFTKCESNGLFKAGSLWFSIPYIIYDEQSEKVIFKDEFSRSWNRKTKIPKCGHLKEFIKSTFTVVFSPLLVTISAFEVLSGNAGPIDM